MRGGDVIRVCVVWMCVVWMYGVGVVVCGGVWSMCGVDVWSGSGCVWREEWTGWRVPLLSLWFLDKGHLAFR